MIITATEFKANLGKYLEIAKKQDIYITKNGKKIALLTNPTVDKLTILNNLVGIAASTPLKDTNSIKESRLKRQ